MKAPLDLNRSVMGLLRYFLEVAYWIVFICCFASLLLGFQRHQVFLEVLGIFGLAIGVYGRFIEPYWFQIVTRQLVLSDSVKRSTRIIFLSDFHTGEKKTRRFYDQLFKRVKALKPDLLLLGGDYVECESRSIMDLSGVKEIQPRYGTHFILGNHDYWDRPEYIRKMLLSFGAEDLTGKTHVIGEGENAFVLTGIDDSWHGTPTAQLPLAPQVKPLIILTHESDVLLDLPEGSAELVLLGHTHGGQIRLPGYGAITRLPQSTPKWLDRGLKTWRGMQLLISQGIGESSAPVRFFARPQIVIVDL